MKVYIVTKANYNDYGLGTQAVEVFKTDLEAVNWMKNDFIKMYKEHWYEPGIVEDARLLQLTNWSANDLKGNYLDNGNIELFHRYAIIHDLYYYDIFTKEIDL